MARALLEHLNRFSIDAGRSLIRFDPFVRLPHDLLGNTERLCLTHWLLPLARLTGASSWMTRPLRSLGLSPTSPLLRVAPSLCLASIRWSLGFHPWTSLFTSRRQVPTFRTRAWFRVTPPLCRVPSRQAADSLWTCPGLTTRPGFDTVPTLSTRTRWFTRVRLPEPHLTRSSRAVSTVARDPGSLPEPLVVVWSLPCRPAPRGRPSSLVQQGCIEVAVYLHHGLLSAPSWRTVISIANQRNQRGAPVLPHLVKDMQVDVGSHLAACPSSSPYTARPPLRLPRAIAAVASTRGGPRCAVRPA
jgi:hypothetical protein